MEQLRLFISIPLDGGLAKKIYKYFTALDLPWDCMRLVLPEQMHLTLKFFGAVPLDKLPEIIKALESVKALEQNFELTLDKVVAIPTTRPEVISIDIQENKQLTDLYNKIEEALFMAGLSNKESRKYHPHLTLARIKKTIEAKELAALYDWKINEIFTASHFSLMQSELTARGPLYTNLQSFDL